eukprot:3658231-Rhodomonas_salina.1
MYTERLKFIHGLTSKLSSLCSVRASSQLTGTRTACPAASRRAKRRQRKRKSRGGGAGPEECRAPVACPLHQGLRPRDSPPQACRRRRAVALAAGLVGLPVGAGTGLGVRGHDLGGGQPELAVQQLVVPLQHVDLEHVAVPQDVGALEGEVVAEGGGRPRVVEGAEADAPEHHEEGALRPAPGVVLEPELHVLPPRAAVQHVPARDLDGALLRARDCGRRFGGSGGLGCASVPAALVRALLLLVEVDRREDGRLWAGRRGRRGRAFRVAALLGCFFSRHCRAVALVGRAVCVGRAHDVRDAERETEVLVADKPIRAFHPERYALFLATPSVVVFDALFLLLPHVQEIVHVPTVVLVIVPRSFILLYAPCRGCSGGRGCKRRRKSRRDLRANIVFSAAPIHPGLGLGRREKGLTVLGGELQWECHGLLRGELASQAHMRCLIDRGECRTA